MPILTPKQSGGVRVEPGIYAVTCVGATEDFIEGSRFGDGAILRIDLELEGETDSSGQPVIVDGIANLTLSPKSKLWGWVKAFGFELEFGTPFNTDDLIGARAQAVIVDKPSTSDPNLVFSAIDQIVPLPRAKGAAPAAKTAAVTSAGLPIGEWWALTRKEGLSQPAVNAAAAHLYGKEPKELTAAERADLVTTMTGCGHEDVAYTEDGSQMFCQTCGVPVEG